MANIGCKCFLYAGSNPACPLHGRMAATRPQPQKCDRCDKVVADVIMVDDEFLCPGCCNDEK